MSYQGKDGKEYNIFTLYLIPGAGIHFMKWNIILHLDETYKNLCADH